MSEQEYQSDQSDAHQAEQQTPVQSVRAYPVYLYENGLSTLSEIIAAQLSDVLEGCPDLPKAPEEGTLSFEQASEISCVGLIRDGRVVPLCEFRGLPSPRTRGQKILLAARAMQMLQEVLIVELDVALQELAILKNEKRQAGDDDGVASGS